MGPLDSLKLGGIVGAITACTVFVVGAIYYLIKGAKKKD